MLDPDDDRYKLCVVCDVMYTHNNVCVQCKRLDTAAAKKDETAHRKRAPVGTWR